ncbi:MAG TPA: hypothetical protein VJA47_06295 [archaeon]|nr:hypothetical protein [archaeon]
MPYNSQACLDGLQGCKIKLERFYQLRDRAENDLRDLGSLEKDRRQELFAKRNFYFGAIRDAEREKKAREEVYFDSLSCAVVSRLG